MTRFRIGFRIPGNRVDQKSIDRSGDELRSEIALGFEAVSNSSRFSLDSLSVFVKIYNFLYQFS